MENAIQPTPADTSAQAPTNAKPAKSTRKRRNANELEQLVLIDATAVFNKLTMNERLPLTTTWFSRLNQSATLLDDMTALYHEILDLDFESALKKVHKLIGVAQSRQLRFLHTQFGQLPLNVQKIEIVFNLWQCSVDGSWGLSADDTLTGSITRPMFDAVLDSFKAKGSSVLKLNDSFKWSSLGKKDVTAVRVVWATERSPWCQGDMQGGKCDSGFTVTNPKLLEIFTVHVNILKVLITKACTGHSGEIVIEPKIVSTLACGSEACKAVGCPPFDPKARANIKRPKTKTPLPLADCTAAPHQASLSYVLPEYLPKQSTASSAPPPTSETTKSFVLYWTTTSLELITIGFARSLNVNHSEMLAKAFELLNDNASRFAKALCAYEPNKISWEDAKKAAMPATEAANFINQTWKFSSSCIKTLEQQKQLMETSYWRQALTMVPGVSSHVPPARVTEAADPEPQASTPSFWRRALSVVPGVSSLFPLAPVTETAASLDLEYGNCLVSVEMVKTTFFFLSVLFQMLTVLYLPASTKN